MGHDISIMYKDQCLSIFPVIGEWVYAVWENMQDNLHITYNLSPIIYDAIRELWLPISKFGERLNNRKCSEASKEIGMIYKKIKENPAKYRPMEPDNWRWTYDGLVKKLRALRQACKKYPECTIHDRY